VFNLARDFTLFEALLIDPLRAASICVDAEKSKLDDPRRDRV
jgi:hypothetical protein